LDKTKREEKKQEDSGGPQEDATTAAHCNKFFFFIFLLLSFHKRTEGGHPTAAGTLPRERPAAAQTTWTTLDGAERISKRVAVGNGRWTGREREAIP
jgi:hypothetical protein